MAGQRRCGQKRWGFDVTSPFSQKRGALKGYVELSRVKVVEKVLDTAFDKPSLQVCLGREGLMSRVKRVSES